MSDRNRSNTTFSVTGPSVESALKALGDHPYVLILVEAACAATRDAKDERKNTPMGRTMRHLQSIARAINSNEGHVHGSHYTCQRVWDEMSEALKVEGAEPSAVYATFRARAGFGTRGSRSGLGGGYSDWDPRSG